MSLFRRERRSADHPTDALHELFLRRRSPIATTAGVPVDPDSAMRLSTVWACIDLITSQVSTLPAHQFRRRRSGTPVKLDDPELFEAPDGELRFIGWRHQLMDSWLKRGNIYGLVLVRNRTGLPNKVKVVHPDSVTAYQHGRLGPTELRLEGSKIERYDPVSGHGDLWHVPAYPPAGSIIGLSPIEYAATTIGIGLAANNFGANWFRDGAVPAALLRNTEQPVNKTIAQTVKQAWMDVLAGGKREPVVMGNGWEYDQISVKPNESQFLDTIRASAVDICGYYRVPPEMVGRAVPGASQTYSNIEMRVRQLLYFTLNPWLMLLEDALTAILPESNYVKFNRDAALAVDSLTRAKVYETMVRNGLMSPDETRELEEREPIPDGRGARFLWPPMRSQLSAIETEHGTDSTATILTSEDLPDEPEPEPEEPLAMDVFPAQDEDDEQEPEPAASGNGSRPRGGSA